MVEHTRTLDFKIAFAIGLGTMIAAGIFSLSGTAVAAIGSSAVIAFVIAAVIAGITAAGYSEFASIYSENGGGYLFSSRTFENDTLVYAIGAMLFLGYTGTTAFYLATMDEWFFRFVLPEAFHVLPHGTTGVLAALLLGTLNARGTEESGMFQLFVTGAKVAVLLAFIGGAFSFRGPSTAVGTFATGFTTDVVGIVSIAALAFITFFGFSAIAASAGEIIEPKRTVPRAIAASIVTVTVLYALVIVAMVNSPVPAEVIAREGETAMGEVAAGFLGPVGRSLIVAGAIFSMVSASNASILAASGIGSLMGRQGQAPRPFSRIHPEYNTPFWSIATATGTIVFLIVAFIMLFPAEGGVLPFQISVPLPVVGSLAITELGLTTLTGFATLNLLLPLSIVNLALIYSRRRYPDIERGFRVPGVPLVPIAGVLANLGLIYNLPLKGVLVGVVLVGALLVAYLSWGGAPAVDELFEKVVEPEPAAEETAGGADTEATDEDRYRVLVAVARPDRAARYIRLADTLGKLQHDTPHIHVLNVTQIPEQTPSEVVRETAESRVTRIEELLAGEDLDADYTVEGHICQDVAFDILQTAREGDVDQILMGYPEEHTDVAETIEYKAPCGVMFVRGFTDETDASVVNVGAGGGPHHKALLPMVERLGRDGAELHVVSVNPDGGGGRAESADATVAGLSDAPEVQIHNVQAATVAEGLVETAAENGGILVIGATRTRRLRRWVFGSTPDRVIDLADGAGVPVIVYAGDRGVQGPIEDYLYPVYRSLTGRQRTEAPADGTSTEGN
ncbi:MULTISPECIES: amino acid permease [Halorubrum]|jgi:amino acid transporter/nucleotide-binding universal stress UspA family protein|uniref:Amino acid permease n=1 Tax=Halorubrum tropicale TaxID=1765655 RepID=A0A0M9ARI5_9EURY|nr:MULTISPECIES: amino acid permease [Halorubrum]KOX97397.1 amino acid permease [Halorubrum tropicale]RLM50228.1 amino acid permease [Halorubrum sp. Atlit-28R]TKX43212.1 amino acid permease [Halorubrum sp. ARQ200]TKX49707.1 amino acid permease [Halorubrum sp. ASP121]TKX62820.1 amino acid permease [Halorubrum sp. ASP1]